MSRPSGLRKFVGPPAQGAPAQGAAAQGAAAPATAPGSGPAAQAAPAQAIPGPLQAALGSAPGPPDDAEEHCEFCATGIPSEHGHVADLEQSSLACACRACYLLFTAVPARGGDPPEPPAISPRGNNPPEPPAISPRGNNPPEPPGSLGSGRTPLRGASPRGVARGDDPPEPPRAPARGEHPCGAPPLAGARRDTVPSRIGICGIRPGRCPPWSGTSCRSRSDWRSS